MRKQRCRSARRGCRRFAKSRCRCWCPPSFAGVLLAFTISFDNTSASLFWRPAGVETMPTQILSMLKISISPEVNALGTVMILVTVGMPLLGGLILQAFTRLKKRDTSKRESMMKIIDTPRDWNMLSERHRQRRLSAAAPSWR